jgi:hypothetical protein
VLCSCSLAILRRGVLQPLERAEYALKGAAVDDQHGRVGGGGHCRRAFVCREQRELACRGQVGGGRSNDAGAFQQAGNGGGLQLAGEVGRGGGGGPAAAAPKKAPATKRRETSVAPDAALVHLTSPSLPRQARPPLGPR